MTRGGTCGSEVWALEAVRDRIDTQIAELAKLRDVLTPLIDACADGCCELSRFCRRRNPELVAFIEIRAPIR